MGIINIGGGAGKAGRALGGWLGVLPVLLLAAMILLAGCSAKTGEASAGGVAESRDGDAEELWARMSERERNMEIFSSMVFPAWLDAFPSNHPRRLLHRWEGDRVIEFGAFEHIADGEYRSVMPGGEHYDDLEDVMDQFQRVLHGISFRIVPEGDADIVFVFSDKNIYDLMTGKYYFRAINFITRTKNKVDASANYNAILQAKAKKLHCVNFHGYKADGGIAKGIGFYQNNPEILHPEWNEKQKEQLGEGNWWKQCAMIMVMSSLGITGQPPRGVLSVWNTKEGHLSDADKFVIRALYSGRVKSGMTKDETLSRLFPAGE